MNESPNKLSPRDQETITKVLKNNKSVSKLAYGQITQKKRSESYKKTINRTQNELSPISKLFSKIIHIKFFEKISDLLASTVARPNALLAGSATSFLLTLCVYVIAKTNGFNLSGFETIVAFIIGWIIGIIYDYFSLFSFKK